MDPPLGYVTVKEGLGKPWPVPACDCEPTRVERRLVSESSGVDPRREEENVRKEGGGDVAVDSKLLVCMVGILETLYGEKTSEN